MTAVSFQSISKTYTTPRGDFHALQDVSLDIEVGEFFGLLGPNGAGKTTLISILAGLARASSGRVSVLGHDVHSDFAAARQRLGIVPLVLGDAIEGEAREVGKALAGMALSCARHGFPARPPCVLLSGGETTVTVRGQGRGGRNTEFLLGLALALDGAPGIDALAADTDGIDGSEDNAGAFVGPDTPARAKAAGINVRACLAGNDAWYCFSRLGDLLVTGPTRTNVNDFRAILIR